VSTRTNKILIFILTISLLILNVNVTYASDGANETNIEFLEPVTIGKVSIKDNVIGEIKNVLLAPIGNEQVMGLTLTINNSSSSELNFIDYWVNVTTKDGTKVTVQTTDNEVKTIPAKSEKNIVFYGKLSSSVKISDLIIKVIKWDFSAAAYMKVLGELKVPQRYSPVTKVNSGRLVNVGGSKTAISVKRAYVGKNSKLYKPEITVVIKNEGTSSITLPDYQFYIMTDKNLMYPLTSSNIKGATLDPITEKEFSLTASIPISVGQDDWKLVVMSSLNEGKDRVPEAIFDLPKTNSNDVVENQKTYTFTTSDGIYEVTLNSLNRLPIEDDDLIIANLTLENNGDSTVPLPEFTGKLTFNDKIEKDASVSDNNKLIAISPGAKTELQLVGRVPYTFEIDKVNLVLQQKETGSTETLDLVEFTHSGEFTQIQSVKGNIGFKISDVGSRSDVKVRNIFTYKGQGADVLGAQLMITNEEKRTTQMQQLAGYFEKSDGTVYPATFQKLSEKLSPGGVAVVYATSTVPKGVESSDVRLVIGKALLEQSSSGAGNNLDEVLAGYVAPYSVILPEEKERQNGLQDIDIKPFELSINRIATEIYFASSLLKFNFDYTLTQDLLAKADYKDQKIVIELKDQNEQSVFSKELSLSGTDETALKVGTNSMELSWTDDKFVMKIQTLKDYELNVYHEIQPGYKKLLATQKLPWLVNRTLVN